jgi:hypothetical protein
MDGCVAQYVVANLRFLMYGLIIPESMCNYAVLQDAKKGDHYSHRRSKTSADRISAEMVTTRRGHNVRQAQPVVNMEFISVLIKTFFLLIPNGDFILHFPLDGK